MAERDLILDVLERRRGDALKGAAKDMDGLGDSTDKTGRSMRDFNRDVDATRAKVRDLSIQFATSSGDTGLLKDLRAARRELGELEKISKIIMPGGNGGGGGLSGLGALGSNLRGAIIPIAIGAAAALSPIIGSAVGVAIVGAAGAGGIIGGIVLASKDTRVKAAWSLVGDTLKEEFQGASAQFVNPLIEGARKIDAAFKDLKPTIDSVFGELAKAVEPLARGGAGFLTNLGPGLRDLASVAGPLMQDLAKELPNIGNAISNMFQSFRQAGPELRAFFGDFLGFIKGAMVGIGNFVEFSAHAYDVLKVGGQSILHFINTLGQSTNVQEGLVRRQLDVMKDVPGMQASISASGQLLTETDQELADAARLAADMINQQNQAFRDLLNTQLGALNANIAYEQSMDDLTQAVDDNGNSLNIHTQKGRDNERAIFQVVGALAAQRDAEVAATNDVDTANTHFQQQIDVLGKHLIALGFSKGAVQALIGKLREVPPETEANIEVTGSPEAIARIKAAKEWLDYLNGRTATMYINVISRNADAFDARRGFASGTPSAPPGWAKVGEAGPEWVNFRGGEAVLPTGRSPAGQGGGPIQLIVNTSGAPMDDLVGDLLRRYVYVRGGDANSVLSTR